jgi:hypothetical protein
MRTPGRPRLAFIKVVRRPAIYVGSSNDAGHGVLARGVSSVDGDGTQNYTRDLVYADQSMCACTSVLAGCLKEHDRTGGCRPADGCHIPCGRAGALQHDVHR